MKLISKASKKKHWDETTQRLDLRKDGKKAWNLVDKLSGKFKRTYPVPLETDKSSKATTDVEKAEAHNVFFSSIKKTKRPNLDRGLRKITGRMEKRSGPLLVFSPKTST